MAKITLLCHNALGKAMAGPAIRYWEFAHALAKVHTVTLMVPNQADISTDAFTIATNTPKNFHYLSCADVIITQMISHKLAWTAKSRGIKLILDAYDPMPLENMELFKPKPLAYRTHQQTRIVDYMNFYFQIADGVICANMYQRDLWIGLLLSLKEISPMRYDADPSLEKFIAIVPFGLSSTPPKRTGDGLKKRFNLNDSDKIILWGGGIWNWFDPLTLIQAMHHIAMLRSDVHLVFMGVKSPDKAAPEMEMASKALALATDLKLEGKHVFFNYDWVPYAERVNFLLDADIGASTHFAHLETRYAFRTRLLDCIWAGLPIVASDGDSFASLIASKEIGLVVPPMDSQALAKAILQILDDTALAQKMKQNLHNLRAQFHWENVVHPIEEMIETLMHAPPKKASLKDFKTIILSLYRTNGLEAVFKELKNRFIHRNDG